MKRNIVNPEWDIVMEVKSLHQPGTLGKLLTVIGEEQGLIGDFTTISIGKTYSVRDITVSVYDKAHLDRVIEAVHKRTKTKILGIKDLVFEKHRGGKIHSTRNQDVKTFQT